ncbi:MAG: VOC family protein [Verrucomicrobiales bacterium]|nr:VOC family protein [Verrucomicrobiales bacterium]
MKILSTLSLGLFLITSSAFSEDTAFTKPTIDIGVVVTDLEASLKFYKEVIGFTEAGSFTASPEVANGAGLSDVTEGIVIKKLKLGDGEGATTLKLMQFGEPKKSDQTYINSTAGISYLTVFVKDTKAALARAAKHDVKPLAKGPVDLGGGKAFLTVIKDPDGNFIEFVGP